MYNLHIQMQLLLLGWKSRSQNACIRTAKESRNLKPQKKKKNPSIFHLHIQKQMCTSLQSMFLNTNKKAARQGHRPKLKSHFPASDAAISTLTLTLAPQLW